MLTVNTCVCAHSWGPVQGDLTVFSHTLVSADLSCSYLHQTTQITAQETQQAKTKLPERESLTICGEFLDHKYQQQTLTEC